MPTIPNVLTQRWLTGELVGDAKHQLVVRVRPGYMDHGYFDERRIDNNSPIYPSLIWKGHNHHCWKGAWRPTGPWVTLPNIQNAKWTRDFTTKGTSTLTVVMDDLQFEDVTGTGGLYHVIQRGWFSPMRGLHATARPSQWAENQWADVLNGAYQIELWEGYGPDGDPTVIPLAVPDVTTHSCAPDGSAISRTWTGLIEDCEMESHPDHITLTARDFGIMLTDQRVMGWNKAREIRAPVTFADRKWTQGESKIAGPYTVSDGIVVGDGTWLTTPQSSPTTLQHIDIELTPGYYTEFFMAPHFGGEEMWLSLYLGPDGGTQDHVHPFPAGWVDLGAGSVPSGGPFFMRHWATLDDLPRRWDLGHGWDVKAGSKLRLTFRNLQPGLGGKYYTGTDGFYAFRFGSNPSRAPGAIVNAKHWVLVEDVSEVIRMVFIWCGFQEWNVETLGWSLYHPMVFGEAKFFMDIIDEILTQGNFVFYMDGPTNDDRSIGVPHFEYQTATNRPPQNMIEVRDTQLAEAATVKWDLSNLPFVMRYRGEVNPTKTGHILDEDLVKRFQATYFPPWTGRGWNTAGIPKNLGHPRTGGVRRHFTQTLGANTTIGLQSDEECLFACVLSAIQFALAECTGTVQVPGYPGFTLNHQVSVTDEGSGVDSRMWVASISSEHQMGEKGYWKMAVGGAYLDTEDMTLIARDYLNAYKLMSKKRPPPSEHAARSLPLVSTLG